MKQDLYLAWWNLENLFDTERAPSLALPRRGVRLAMAALALLLAACGAEPTRPRQTRPSTGNAHPAATSTSERPPLDCAECRPMLPYEDCGRHLEYDCPAPRSAMCGISRLPDPCDPACCADAPQTRSD